MGRWTDHGQADIYDSGGTHIGKVTWGPDYERMMSEGLVGVLFAILVFFTVGLILLVVQLVIRFPKTTLIIIAISGVWLWHMQAESEANARAAAAAQVAQVTTLEKVANNDLAAMRGLPPVTLMEKPIITAPEHDGDTFYEQTNYPDAENGTTTSSPIVSWDLDFAGVTPVVRDYHWYFIQNGRLLGDVKLGNGQVGNEINNVTVDEHGSIASQAVPGQPITAAVYADTEDGGRSEMAHIVGFAP